MHGSGLHSTRQGGLSTRAVMRRLALVLALSACSTVQLNGEFSGGKEAAEIAELEDRRSLGDGRLVLLALTANDPAVRARGLLALGRIQDPTTAEAIVKGLSDPDVTARATAAFGVGLFGLSWQPLTPEVKATLTTALLAADDEEDQLSVKLALIDAMGRVATADALTRLVDRLGHPLPEVRAHAGTALGVAVKALKAQLPAKAFEVLPTLLRPDSTQAVRVGAAYGLAMSKDPASRAGLLTCAKDESAQLIGSPVPHGSPPPESGRVVKGRETSAL